MSATHASSLPARVAVTDEAADLLRRLVGIHGPVMFHQSGGCCDGSAPMCYPSGDFMLGDADIQKVTGSGTPSIRSAASRTSDAPVRNSPSR